MRQRRGTIRITLAIGTIFVAAFGLDSLGNTQSDAPQDTTAQKYSRSFCAAGGSTIQEKRAESALISQ